MITRPFAMTAEQPLQPELARWKAPPSLCRANPVGETVQSPITGYGDHRRRL